MFDWFTLAAQIMNFLILVFLLKHFLYNKIIEVMEKRKQRIASKLDEAQQKKESAEQKVQEYDSKLEELETTRKEKLKEAEEEAETRHKELLKEARQEVEQSREEWQKALEQEKQQFLNDVRQMTGEQIYAVTRRLLKDLAGEDVEQQVVRKFLEQLQQLQETDEETYHTLQELPQDHPLYVTSAFELSKDLQTQISDTLKQFAQRDSDIEFTRNSELLGGIELRVNGSKFQWSIAGYLDALEDEWNDALQQHIAEKEKE